MDIVVNGEKIGAIIGGQVLPSHPDEDAFRKTAEELNIDPEQYVKALRKVPVSTEKKIRAAAELLGIIVNQLVNLEYFKSNNSGRLDSVQNQITEATALIDTINKNTSQLKSIATKQNILSLNASIEAARSGEAGVGFAVVAKSMQDLSSQSAAIYGDIEKSVAEITKTINILSSAFEAN